MSLHEIASSLQRKIRSDFPLSMLHEKSLNIETFLISCYSGKSKDILEVSKSLKKDLESFLESNEKSLSQHITQDFDKLISIPSLMLNLEVDISDLNKQSLSFSSALHRISSEVPKITKKVLETLESEKVLTEENEKKENSIKFSQFLTEIQEKLKKYKECVSLSTDKKLIVSYQAIPERISSLVVKCENIIKNQGHSEFSKEKGEFLLVLQKETIFWATQHSGSLHFKSLLKSYKNLGLEDEVQIILRNMVVVPIVKEFIPQQTNLIDDFFDLDNFFQRILDETKGGRLQFFVEYSENCNILIKSL